MNQSNKLNALQSATFWSFLYLVTFQLLIAAGVELLVIRSYEVDFPIHPYCSSGEDCEEARTKMYIWLRVFLYAPILVLCVFYALGRAYSKRTNHLHLAWILIPNTVFLTYRLLQAFGRRTPLILILDLVFISPIVFATCYAIWVQTRKPTTTAAPH